MYVRACVFVCVTSVSVALPDHLRTHIFLWVEFVHFVVPMGIYSLGNSGRFPSGKPAATESRYPTLIYYKVQAGSFRLSIIHRTLTLQDL